MLGNLDDMTNNATIMPNFSSRSSGVAHESTVYRLIEQVCITYMCIENAEIYKIVMQQQSSNIVQWIRCDTVLSRLHMT